MFQTTPAWGYPDPKIMGRRASDTEGGIRFPDGRLSVFPAGRIEPDPRVAPPGEPLLLPWKAGLDTLLGF